ncbi:MarR family winged helix-turn-helix transcriptional regulator [Actinomadura kijaniata]|uniref:MarR family winged helix-turn-helix transcriptional regulator n=1 Tax=Actinomadura kijaniata TaxID=46161 RepID=UPI003F1D460D
MDDTREVPERLLGITTFLLAQVARAGRARMGRMLEERGLGLWHFAVLAALAEGPPAAQGELGPRLRIDPSDLVEVLGRLEGAGLVRRDRDPRDRRRYVIELTGAGRAELEEVTRRAAELDAGLLAPLDAGERAVLERALRTLFDHHDPRGRRAGR